MIYTIFFRKLQKKFGVAIQTMGYATSQKVYTPHLDIGKVQTMNDNHYHYHYHYDSKNDIDYHYDSMNASINHFHLAGKCVRDYGGVLVWCEIVC